MNRQVWIENAFRPMVIGAMVGCIALSVVDFVRLFAPRWNGAFLVVGCVLAALEAHYSYQLIRLRRLSGNERLRFRAVELGLFFLLLKLGSYAGDGLPTVLADIQAWSRDPVTIIDAETVMAFALAVLAWQATNDTLYDLDRLSEPVEREALDNRAWSLDSLIHRFFMGGAVLLITAGLTRLGLAGLLNRSHPSVPGLVLNVLVYFVLGLVMLGQVRLIALRTTWQAQGIKVAEALASRWVRYSLTLVGLAALLAFLLPTRHTFGLLDIVGTALGLISLILYFILQLLVLLITLPFAWLIWLLSRLLGGRALPPPPPPPQNLFRAPGTIPPWFEILRSLFFWAVVIGMVVYILRSYLRDHPELAKALSTLGPIRALRHWWAALRQKLGGWVGTVQVRFPRAWLMPFMRRKPAAGLFRFFRLGGASPREQILYYYLSLAQRAGQQGFPRRTAQTPYEYQPTLDAHLPESRQEVGEITGAFVEARYSAHTIEVDRARRVRADWERVRRALQLLRRKRN